MNYYLRISIVLLYAPFAFALNPITPANIYIADPEAHVFPDGKLYVYGSNDESNKHWCSHVHHVLSTSDLVNWDISYNSFSSKGFNDQVKDHDRLLFAPDCAYKDGKYYLYFCSPGNDHLTEGVAVSDNPNGPFVNGKIIPQARMIDPAVLVEGDDAYYFWGQGQPKVAKLNSDMLSIDESTIIDDCLMGNASENYFHEGSSIRKIGDTYYLVYADESRRGRPTSLGYATSKNPMGPYEYQGVIIDNYGCDPATWNNHGSIEEFKGQWYVFYHRTTNGFSSYRKACVEPITINPDGSIDEVKMTSQGGGSPIKASSLIEAEWACEFTGSVVFSDREDVAKLAKINSGSTACYRYIDFGEGVSEFSAKIIGISKGGTIHVCLDSPDGVVIAKCNIPKSSEKNSRYVKCDVSKVSGVHSVYLKFEGDGENLFEVDSISFSSIIPYLKLNGNELHQENSVSLNIGDNVLIKPDSPIKGAWSWTGPNGFKANSRSIILDNIQPLQSGNYVVKLVSGKRVDFYTFNILVVVPDIKPPFPEIAMFEVSPFASGIDSVTMKAFAGTDKSEPIEYSFVCTSGGGSDSGWQESNSFTDTGLKEGKMYSYSVTMRDAKGNTGNASKPSVVILTQSPFNGSKCSIPGIIQVEDFDCGGQGRAYDDADTTNNGGMYRADGVDIETVSDTDGGYNIGYTSDGEWLEYTVDVAAGIYEVEARIATPETGGKLCVILDGKILCTLDVLKTGGWQTWQTVKVPDVKVAGGKDSTLRLEVIKGGFNVNWLKFID